MRFEDWLAERYAPMLRFATVLCGPDQAEDVLQTVVLKAQSRWSTIAGLDHPYGYLRRMIVNEHVSWHRRWSRIVPHADLQDVPRAGGPPSFDEAYADRQALVAEVRRLPKRQGVAIVLRYFEDLDDRAVAAAMGCAEGTVRSHISKGLRTLRVQLDRNDDAETNAGEASHAH